MNNFKKLLESTLSESVVLRITTKGFSDLNDDEYIKTGKNFPKNIEDYSWVGKKYKTCQRLT